MRLIFMGTPDFAVPSLARLIDDGHELAAVFTQPDKPAGRGKKVQPPAVKTFALAHGLPVYQPARIKTSEEVRALFEQVAPDACIVAAYGRILPGWLLNIPRLGCINVHASLLPRYRGAAPINWVIANGERQTGVTIMQMDEGMDTGGIFRWRATGIGPEETAQELSPRLAVLGAGLLSETLPDIERGEIRPVPQDESQATYAPILKREDGLIDWRMDSARIADRVRGFQPWPGTYTMFRGSRLMIWRARAVPLSQPEPPENISPENISPEKMNPANIIEIDKSGFTIACANQTALHVEELQVEGKRRVGARDFINGTRLGPGDRLG